MKSYVKPELFYESFEMNQSIAACGIDVTNSTDPNSCTATLDEAFFNYLGGTVVFNENCPMDIKVIEIYCYTTGTSEAGKLFNS